MARVEWSSKDDVMELYKQRIWRVWACPMRMHSLWILIL